MSKPGPNHARRGWLMPNKRFVATPLELYRTYYYYSRSAGRCARRGAGPRSSFSRATAGACRRRAAAMAEGEAVPPAPVDPLMSSPAQAPATAPTTKPRRRSLDASWTLLARPKAEAPKSLLRFSTMMMATTCNRAVLVMQRYARIWRERRKEKSRIRIKERRRSLTMQNRIAADLQIIKSAGDNENPWYSRPRSSASAPLAAAALSPPTTGAAPPAPPPSRPLPRRRRRTRPRASAEGRSTTRRRRPRPARGTRASGGPA
mgnify:CR=1 FL=1